MIRTTGDKRDTRVVACAGFRLFSLVSSFDAHRNAHAAADAERGETLLRIALLHFVEQRDHASLPRPPKNPDQTPAADDIAICKPPKIPLLRPCERSIKSAYEIRVEQEAGGSGGKERAEEILPISDCAARTAQRPASWLLALAVSFR